MLESENRGDAYRAYLGTTRYMEALFPEGEQFGRIDMTYVQAAVDARERARGDLDVPSNTSVAFYNDTDGLLIEAAQLAGVAVDDLSARPRFTVPPFCYFRLAEGDVGAPCGTRQLEAVQSTLLLFCLGSLTDCP